MLETIPGKKNLEQFREHKNILAKFPQHRREGFLVSGSPLPTRPYPGNIGDVDEINNAFRAVSEDDAMVDLEEWKPGTVAGTAPGMLPGMVPGTLSAPSLARSHKFEDVDKGSNAVSPP